MVSQSPCPMALSTPLEGFTTPPSYESAGSRNPYDYMPSTPSGCRFISDDSSSSSTTTDSRDECECEDGDGDNDYRRAYKRTLPARVFLDLDDRDEIPFFPTLRNTRSTKKLKSRADPLDTSHPMLLLSVLRVLEQDLDLDLPNAKETAWSTPERPHTIPDTPMTPTSSETAEPSLDSALLLAVSSSHGSININIKNSSSSSSSSAHTVGNIKLEPRLSLSGLPLGKQLQRRHSGTARCA
eukprot:CAMPEP_0172363790 /NCGR_PEP_ID=MMETSP1060-20121228/7055_1 /TAXON_ID=37318 /ORGANISM="Pseudo-nitzschia pungens, Strain cf. cingulata" /LENGTH=239 /DNA_ID=CAMNT_0013086617 /DNA_START=174 /DNA_END=893 /DNA_ORIENTATION=+